MNNTDKVFSFIIIVLFCLLLYLGSLGVLTNQGYFDDDVKQVCDEFGNETSLEYCGVAQWGLTPGGIRQIRSCQVHSETVLRNCETFWVENKDGEYIFREVSGD